MPTHLHHHHQVDVFLPNASSAQGNAPLATTVLQPYRRNTSSLLTPRNPTPANATVMVHQRPRQPMPMSWFQDVYVFAMLNRKDTYCPGTGTPEQALCRSNHGLMDGVWFWWQLDDRVNNENDPVYGPPPYTQVATCSLSERAPPPHPGHRLIQASSPLCLLRLSI